MEVSQVPIDNSPAIQIQRNADVPAAGAGDGPDSLVDAIKNISVNQVETSVSGKGPVVLRKKNGEKVDVDKAITEYFRPVHEEYLRKQGTTDQVQRAEFKISQTLVKNLLSFTHAPDFLKASRGVLLGVYHETTQVFNVSEEQSDLHDLLLYHPLEAISTKMSQVLFAIALVEPQLALEGMQELQDILEEESSRLDQVSREVYGFVMKTITGLYETLSGRKVELKRSQYPKKAESTSDAACDYKDLSGEHRAFLGGLKALFIRWFRTRRFERIEMMKQAHEGMPANVEWILYLCHNLRMERRDSIKKQKRPSKEEMEYLDLALQMEPMNPFVRLNLIDTVVDAVREVNGSFKCGEKIELRDMDQAMKFLQKECRSLCHDFPKNVHVKSVVSDYFVRYVPYLYFDKDFSGKHLQDAIALNPNNARTTHRLGIYHRMLMKNIPESLKWLKRTVELDPSHANGNLDYFKTLLGNPEQYPEVGQAMEAVLNGPNVLTWKPYERYEFQFCIGLAYFAAGEKDKAMEHWLEVIKHNETFFTLDDVSLYCNIFSWDSKYLSTEKLIGWILKEYEQIRGIESRTHSGEKKKLLSRIFNLMMNARIPKRPQTSSGPYSVGFLEALDPNILKLVSP